MKRRSFLIHFGGAIAAAPIALQLAGCGSDDNQNPPQDANNPPQDADNPAQDAGADGGNQSADCTANGAAVSNISANHGHFLDIGMIPPEDVNDPQPRTYSIRGASGHPHTLSLTAEHFEMLAAGETLVVESSFDAGHPHTVTIVCA